LGWYILDVNKKTKKSQLIPVLACALAFAIWGFNTPMSEKTMTVVPLFLLLFLRFILSTAVFGALAIRRWKPIPTKLWPRIFVATLFGYVINAVTFYKGVTMTGGLNASLIYLLGPILLYFASIRILKDRYSHKLMLSVVAGFFGTVLIVAAPLFAGQGSTGGSLIGNVLIIVAAVTDVLGTILIKPVLKKVSTMQLVAVRSAITLAFMVPLIFHELPQIPHIHLTPETTLTLGYNLIFSTLIGIYLYHWGFRRVSGVRMSPLQYLDPTVGAIASMIILSQRPAASTLVGISLVFAGLYAGGGHKLRIAHHATHHR